MGFWIHGCGMSEGRRKKQEVRRKDRRSKVEDRVCCCGRSEAIFCGVGESSFCLALTAVFLRSGGLGLRFRVKVDWFVMTREVVIASVTQWSAAISRCQAERLFKGLQNCDELEPCPTEIASSLSLQGLAPSQRSAEPASFVNAMTNLGKA